MEVQSTTMISNFHSTWFGAVLIFMLAMCLAGCGSEYDEVGEAKRFASELKALVPAASKLIADEHDIANELKIILNESGVGSPPTSRAKTEGTQIEPEILEKKPETIQAKLSSFVDRLIALRNARQQLLANVRQGVWQAAMVFAVQMDAVGQLNYEIERTEAWLELAQNVRLRTDLGRKGDFPELPKLNHELDSYLQNSRETPLFSQILSLIDEYRFGYSEVK